MWWILLLFSIIYKDIESFTNRKAIGWIMYWHKSMRLVTLVTMTHRSVSIYLVKIDSVDFKPHRWYKIHSLDCGYFHAFIRGHPHCGLQAINYQDWIVHWTYTIFINGTLVSFFGTLDPLVSFSMAPKPLPTTQILLNLIINMNY